MKITLIREADARTSIWSGGVSKEYYCHSRFFDR